MEDEGEKRYQIALDAPSAVVVVQFAAVILGFANMVLGLNWGINSDLSIAVNIGMILCLAFTLPYSFHRVKIDSEVIRTRVPFHKDRCGSMRWEDVRVVGIYRSSGKKGRLFISTVPKVWYIQDLTSNSFDPNQLVAFQNSRRSLKIIRRFYSGEIVEIQ